MRIKEVLKMSGPADIVDLPTTASEKSEHIANGPSVPLTLSCVCKVLELPSSEGSSFYNYLEVVLLPTENMGITIEASLCSTSNSYLVKEIEEGSEAFKLGVRKGAFLISLREGKFGSNLLLMDKHLLKAILTNRTAEMHLMFATRRPTVHSDIIGEIGTLKNLKFQSGVGGEIYKMKRMLAKSHNYENQLIPLLVRECNNSWFAFVVEMSEVMIYAGRVLWAMYEHDLRKDPLSCLKEENGTFCRERRPFLSLLVQSRVLFNCVRYEYFCLCQKLKTVSVYEGRSSDIEPCDIVDEEMKFNLTASGEWNFEVCLKCNGCEEGNTVVCDNCGFPFHATCIEMSDEDYTCLSKSENILWQCSLCNYNERFIEAVMENDLKQIAMYTEYGIASPFWQTIETFQCSPSQCAPKCWSAVHHAAFRNATTALQMMLQPFRDCLPPFFFEIKDSESRKNPFKLAIDRKNVTIASQLFVWGGRREEDKALLVELFDNLAAEHQLFAASTKFRDASRGVEPNVRVSVTLLALQSWTESFIYITECLETKDISRAWGKHLKKCECETHECSSEIVFFDSKGGINMLQKKRKFNGEAGVDCGVQQHQSQNGHLHLCNFNCLCYKPSRILENTADAIQKKEFCSRMSSGVCARSFHRTGLCFHFEVFFVNEFVRCGLRTLEHIKKGSFVIEYVGEIISRDMEEQRYGELGGDYVMELPTKKYVVDAQHFRNAASFVNHRCKNANLKLQFCYGNHKDQNFPHLMLFAKRDIDPREELTLCYTDGLTGLGRRSFFNPCYCSYCLSSPASND
jgi:hypothetical protein